MYMVHNQVLITKEGQSLQKENNSNKNMID